MLTPLSLSIPGFLAASAAILSDWRDCFEDRALQDALACNAPFFLNALARATRDGATRLPDNVCRVLNRQLRFAGPPLLPDGTLNPAFLVGRELPDYSFLELGASLSIPRDHIIPTQEVLFADRIERYRQEGYRTLPEVILLGGVLYVAVGHHRITTQAQQKPGQPVAVYLHDPKDDPAGLVPTVRERMFVWELMVWKQSMQG